MVLGQNPPEIAYWERGEWWLAGDPRPWQREAVTVLSDRLMFRPRLAPVAYEPMPLAYGSGPEPHTSPRPPATRMARRYRFLSSAKGASSGRLCNPVRLLIASTTVCSSLAAALSASRGSFGRSPSLPRPGWATAFSPGLRRCFDLGMRLFSQPAQSGRFYPSEVALAPVAVLARP